MKKKRIYVGDEIVQAQIPLLSKLLIKTRLLPLFIDYMQAYDITEGRNLV
jgi:hypothetical protein